MNIYDIHIKIQQGLQKNGVFAYQNIGHDVIDLYLDFVCLEYIKDIIKKADKPTDGFNNDTYNLAALKDITAHKIEQSGLTIVTGPTGSKSANLAADLLIPIKVYIDMTYTCDKVNKTEYKRCTLRDADIAYDLLDHAIYKPTRENPLAFIYGSKVNVLTDGNYTVSKIYMDYIKTYTRPKLVLDNNVYNPVDSVQLPIHVNAHNDIVQRTIAEIKSYSEGNPNVIQRIDQKQILN